MVSSDSKVKDKRIEVKGLMFLAVVEYYRDKPDRDGDHPITQMFESLAGSQRFLEKYPRDDWTAYAISDRDYMEPDDKRRR